MGKKTAKTCNFKGKMLHPFLFPLNMCSPVSHYLKILSFSLLNKADYTKNYLYQANITEVQKILPNKIGAKWFQ